MMVIRVTWNGEVYDVPCPYPCTAGLALESFFGRHPDFRRAGLALFTTGMTEVEGSAPVEPGSDLILRPRVIH